MRDSDLTDEELMADYQLGSEDAFRALYARHSAKVFTFIKRRIRDPEKASDVFQEVYIKMHRSKHLYNRTFPYLPWLFSISRSVVIDAMRTEARRGAEFSESDLEQYAQEPKDALENSSDLHRIEAQLAELPPAHRKAMQLRYVDERTFDEIADVLGTSPLNARQLISRGLKRLKELISKDEEGDGHERSK